MKLDPKTSRQISHPDELSVLVPCAKDGVLIGLENWNTPEGSLEIGYDRFGELLSCSPFAADLDYLRVITATRKWVTFHNWIDNPDQCGNQ